MVSASTLRPGAGLLVAPPTAGGAVTTMTFSSCPAPAEGCAEFWPCAPTRDGLNRVVSVRRTITSLYLLVENPVALTTTSYSPTGSEAAVKLPLASENTVRIAEAPPAGAISTCAFEIGAPLPSTTAPAIAPVAPPCAFMPIGKVSATTSKHTNPSFLLLIIRPLFDDSQLRCRKVKIRKPRYPQRSSSFPAQGSPLREKTLFAECMGLNVTWVDNHRNEG